MIFSKITAIIQSYRRQDNIPFIIKALRNQSVKPVRIIVWNDNDGSGRDLHNLGKDIEIINTNTNHNSNYGAFLFSYLADTKYIALIDDDYPPAKDWFKFCVDNQKEHLGVYGRFGERFSDDNYNNRTVIYSELGKEVKFNKVDMVGHTYFFPKEAVLPMFSIRPTFWLNNVDMHFSFLAMKYGWNLYIPTVVSVDQLPWDKNIKIPFTDYDNAMFTRGDHLERRDKYLKWARKTLLF